DPNTLTLSINEVNDSGDVLADGKGFREVRVVTTDANGNIAPSTHIIIDGNGGSTVNGVLLTDGGETRPSAAGAGKVALVTGDDGTITFRVASLNADIAGTNHVFVGAAIAGKPRGYNRIILRFSPDLSRAKLELTVVKNNAVADGADKNRVSVVVRDGISGYELPGIEVIFDGGLVTANGVTLGDNGTTAPMQPGKGRVSVTTSYGGVTELELTSKTIGTTQSWVGAGIRGQARSVHTWLAFNNVFVGDIQRLTWDSSCKGSFEGIKTLGLETVRVLLDASSMGPECDSRARQALRWTLTDGVSVNNLNPNVLWDNKLELRCRVGDGATGTIEFTKGGVKTLLHVTCS
ncbi:TPA: hypothetical protein SMF55_003706, partial [Serratia liquefaciens]|nr:hypothetical protein [Serratia liquefaciens]